MNFASPAYGAGPAAAVASTTAAKSLSILGIVVMVGTGLFIVAIGVGLGVGFGVGLRYSSPTSTKLIPQPVSCSPSATCGCPTIQPSFASRIVNGNPAVPNSWPWMVYLTTFSNTRTCSGILISPRHVLTAASCVNPYGYNDTVNLGAYAYQFTFGGVNVSNATALQTISYGDIAVVTLGVNITYTATIQPCCLTSSLIVPSVNADGVIAGWGETSTNSIGTVSPVLRQAVVQVRNTSVCGTQSGNDTLCASYDSIEACPIDAGGPLMVGYGNGWTCVGLMNGRTSTTCTNPITFTRIATYISLIQNVTGLIITS